MVQLTNILLASAVFSVAPAFAAPIYLDSIRPREFETKDLYIRDGPLTAIVAMIPTPARRLMSLKDKIVAKFTRTSSTANSKRSVDADLENLSVRQIGMDCAMVETPSSSHASENSYRYSKLMAALNDHLEAIEDLSARECTDSATVETPSSTLASENPELMAALYNEPEDIEELPVIEVFEVELD